MTFKYYFPMKYFQGRFGGHKTSSTQLLFIKVPVPHRQSEGSCICVLGVLIFRISLILIFDFGTVPTGWYFICFSF